jgi:hypothetical protein
VASKWVDGKLVFYNKATGAAICTFDPAGNIDTVALKVNGTAITLTAAQINALPIVEQATIAAIATVDASAQTASYVQADVESIRTLANANKAKINDIIAKLKLANIVADS